MNDKITFSLSILSSIFGIFGTNYSSYLDFPILVFGDFCRIMVINKLFNDKFNYDFDELNILIKNKENIDKIIKRLCNFKKFGQKINISNQINVIEDKIYKNYIEKCFVKYQIEINKNNNFIYLNLYYFPQSTISIQNPLILFECEQYVGFFNESNFKVKFIGNDLNFKQIKNIKKKKLLIVQNFEDIELTYKTNLQKYKLITKINKYISNGFYLTDNKLQDWYNQNKDVIDLGRCVICLINFCDELNNENEIDKIIFKFHKTIEKTRCCENLIHIKCIENYKEKNCVICRK